MRVMSREVDTTNPQCARGGKIALDNDNGYRYYRTVITSFRCRETEKIFKGKFSATLPQAIQKAAARKLEIIDAARDLEDLRIPPCGCLVFSGILLNFG